MRIARKNKLTAMTQTTDNKMRRLVAEHDFDKSMVAAQIKIVVEDLGEKATRGEIDYLSRTFLKEDLPRGYPRSGR